MFYYIWKETILRMFPKCWSRMEVKLIHVSQIKFWERLWKSAYEALFGLFTGFPSGENEFVFYPYSQIITNIYSRVVCIHFQKKVNLYSIGIYVWWLSLFSPSKWICILFYWVPYLKKYISNISYCYYLLFYNIYKYYPNKIIFELNLHYINSFKIYNDLYKLIIILWKY